MSEAGVEVYYQDGEWRIGIPQVSDPISRHETQDAAVEAGQAEAQRRGVELIVRNERATVVERDAQESNPPNVPD
jgi:hypothetical protein